jgi:RNA polymerase sigma factor (sigma-70 family)
MKPPAIPAEAGNQSGPMFRGFAAFFGKGLGPVLRRDDESVRCAIGIRPAFENSASAGRCHVAVNFDVHGYDSINDTSAAPTKMTSAGGLASIFMANRPALTRYVRARYRGDGEAEDIVQDLWMKMSSLETGPIAEPLAYLYRMAENLVLDRRRSAMRRGNREREWTRGQIDGTLESPVDSQPDAERVLLARDHLRRVDAVLNDLPERTAFAFRAVRIEGTPQKDIAAQMGISLSAVEKHLQRAYRAVLAVQKYLDAETGQPERHAAEGHDHVG